MCFLVEYPAFELGQAFPGHLAQAGRCSQLEAPPRAAAAAPGSAGPWESSRAGSWLQGNVQPAGTPQAWAGSGVRGALAWPRVRGHCQVLRCTKGWFSSTGQCRLDSRVPRVLHSRLVLMKERNIASPLLSLNRILTWCFHNSSELFAITHLAIQHL